MQINDDFYENLTREKVDKILEELRAKAMTFYSPVITNASEVAKSERLHLFRYVEDPKQRTIETFESHGGYQTWRKVVTSMKRGRGDRRGQSVRLARPRRRRIPDRHEVGLRPERFSQSRAIWSATPMNPNRGPARIASSWSVTRTP